MVKLPAVNGRSAGSNPAGSAIKYTKVTLWHHHLGLIRRLKVQQQVSTSKMSEMSDKITLFS